MKALTVQQPWAWAIVHGGKDVENRTTAWKYRGPLAIHAGTRWSDRGTSSPLVNAACDRVFGAASTPLDYIPGLRPEVWNPGSIIGVVDLVDVHSSTTCVDADGAMCSAWAEASYAEHGGRTRRDIVHLVLEDPIKLAEPIPCVGQRGLWTPPADVLAELEVANR